MHFFLLATFRSFEPQRETGASARMMQQCETAQAEQSWNWIHQCVCLPLRLSDFHSEIKECANSTCWNSNLADGKQDFTLTFFTPGCVFFFFSTLKSIIIRVSLEYLILIGGQFQFQNGHFSNSFWWQTYTNSLWLMRIVTEVESRICLWSVLRALHCSSALDKSI